MCILTSSFFSIVLAENIVFFYFQEKIVTMTSINPSKDLLKELIGNQDLPPDQYRKVTQLRDLLDRVLMLDNSKRATTRDALSHPFIAERI
jgi:serine/threonine-protein kinase PRP4